MSLSMQAFTDDPTKMGLAGVFNGQTGLEFLGLTGLTKQLGYSFYIGFDTRVKPATVRVFFDPSRAFLAAPDWDYISIIQLGQILFQGVPIEPEVYGADLAALQSYTFRHPFSAANLEWTDMMDVTQAKRFNITEPFFPFNNLLVNSTLQEADLFIYPKLNGTLTRLPFPTTPNAALCASLISDVRLDRDYPSEAFVRDRVLSQVTSGIEPIAQQVYTREQILSRGVLPLAMDLLGLTGAEIDAVESVGPFLLIRVIGEEWEDLICTFPDDATNPTDKTLKAYLLSEREFQEARQDEIGAMFLRIKERLRLHGLFGTKGIPVDYPVDPDKKGGRGLQAYPFYFSDGVSPVLEIKYQTLAVGKRQGRLAQCFGGVEWSAVREFDPDELRFGALRITEPALLGQPVIDFNAFLGNTLSFPKVDPISPVLNTFYNAIRPPDFRALAQPTRLAQPQPPAPQDQAPAPESPYEYPEDVIPLKSSGFGDWSDKWLTGGEE